MLATETGGGLLAEPPIHLPKGTRISILYEDEDNAYTKMQLDVGNEPTLSWQ